MKIHLGNIQGLRSNLSEVRAHLTTNSPDLLFLTETQITRPTPDLAAPNDYRLVSSFAKKHGVCVYIHPKLSYARAIKYEINNKFFNSIVLRLPIDKTSVFIFAIYRSPNTPSNIDSFEDVSDSLCSLLSDYPEAQLIVLGDFNIHNSSWLKHSSHTDVPGRRAEFLASTFGLQQLVEEPTRIPKNSQFANTLDLVLSSFIDSSCVSVSPPLGSSDHCLITITTQFTPSRLSSSAPRLVYRYSKANWAELESFYKSYPWRLVTSCQNINNAVNSLTDGIKLGMKLYIPSIRLREGKKQQIFSAKARNALKEKKQAYHTYNKIRASAGPNCPTLKASRDVLRSISNKCKAIINTENYQFFKTKTDKTLEHPNDPRFYYHTVRSLQTNFVKPTSPPLNNNGIIVSDPLQKCNLLASIFAGNSRISNPNQQPKPLPKVPHRMKPIFIRRNVILKYLLGLNIHKASGPDGIPALILKKFARIFAPILTKIFAISIRSGQFPDGWKFANIQPIPKKGDKADPNNYRPIAIISVLSKIFEKYINWHVLNYIENSNILSERQYGFRKGRSTCDALTMLTHNWNKILEESSEAYVISLDMAKAFDTVWHENLISKLKSYGFDDSLTILLSNFLSKRKIAVVLDGYTSDLFELSAGVPQGSPLASTLFLIYVNDLLSITNNSLHSYADDTTLHGKISKEIPPNPIPLSMKRKNLTDSLTTDLKSIDSWSKKNLMKINPCKTQLCVVSRKKNKSPESVSINEQPLSTCKSLRLLGVSISEKLLWNEHVENIAKSSAQKLGFLARCRKFFNSEQSLKIYKSMIRPCIEYGSPVWGGASETELEILDSVQRRAIKIIKDSTLTASLHSLQHRRDVADLSLFYRYHFGLCSTELKSMVPARKAFNRETRNSKNAHRYTVEETTCRTTHFQNDFFSRTAYKWNRLPPEVFRTANLDAFKSAVHKHLLDHPSPRLSLHQQ